MIRKVRTYIYWTYGVKLMRNDSSVTQAAKVHAFWFYAYFGEVTKPLITMKEDHHLAAPPSFTARDTTRLNFWINPPEPGILLSRRRLEPTALYLPRIFLWLPHFLVKILYCPTMQNGRPRKKWCYSPSSALAALLIWTIAITSSPGGITVARDASYTSHPGDVLF